MAGQTLTVGNVTITSLQDAFISRFPYTLDQLFPAVASDDWRPYRERYPSMFPSANELAVDIGCYALRSGGRTILIDTGIGQGGSPAATFLGVEGALGSRLNDAGVSADSVDTVILTHLHFDHVGGCVVREGTRERLMFPNARHMVHRADWEAFHLAEVQAAFPFEFVEEMATPLERLGGLQLIDAAHAVTDEVSILPTPGHTPGSVSVVISSAGEKAVIWGDAFVHPATVTEPGWGFSFEMDAEAAVKSRTSLLDLIESEGMTAVACHFPDPGFGKIVRIDGRRYWQGI